MVLYIEPNQQIFVYKKPRPLKKKKLIESIAELTRAVQKKINLQKPVVFL